MTLHYYYVCPAYRNRACTNRLYLPGNWLWRAVVARVRERLFSLPSDGSDPPWFAELATAVRRALQEAADRDEDRRPLLQRERRQLQTQIDGWTQSLANAELPGGTRRHIEEKMTAAIARLETIDAELASLDAQAGRLVDLADSAVVVDRLRRLDELLGAANPAEINGLLARHAERILVAPDGGVRMESHRLGVFEGEPVVLGRTDDDASGRDGKDPATSIEDGDAEHSGLPTRWVGEALFIMPRYTSWSREHAEEVTRLRRETGWSQAQLATHFGKSIPTIRRALRMAEPRSPEERQ